MSDSSSSDPDSSEDSINQLVAEVMLQATPPIHPDATPQTPAATAADDSLSAPSDDTLEPDRETQDRIGEWVNRCLPYEPGCDDWAVDCNRMRMYDLATSLARSEKENARLKTTVRGLENKLLRANMQLIQNEVVMAAGRPVSTAKPVTVAQAEPEEPSTCVII